MSLLMNNDAAMQQKSYRKAYAASEVHCCSVGTWRISNITHLMNHTCELKSCEIKQGKKLPRHLFPMSTDRWDSFTGILIWKKWVTPTFWEKPSSLHSSIYANIQPAPRFIPDQRQRRPVWKWQQRRKSTHWSRDYKIIFPPPQMSCGTETTAFYCAYCTRTVLIQSISQNR